MSFPCSKNAVGVKEKSRIWKGRTDKGERGEKKKKKKEPEIECEGSRG